MDLKIDRKVRRRIAEAGGLVTIEARAKTGCMVTTELEVRTGKPEEPTLYTESEAGGVRVFARGTVEGPDGSVRASEAALPARVRLRDDGGRLRAEAG